MSFIISVSFGNVGTGVVAFRWASSSRSWLSNISGVNITLSGKSKTLFVGGFDPTVLTGSGAGFQFGSFLKLASNWPFAFRPLKESGSFPVEGIPNSDFFAPFFKSLPTGFFFSLMYSPYGFSTTTPFSMVFTIWLSSTSVTTPLTIFLTLPIIIELPLCRYNNTCLFFVSI